jgi:hypothetical protein
MKRALCLIAAVPLVAFGGCGDDDDSASETPVLTPTVSEPAPLSRENFITAADGICAEVNAALGTLASSDTDTSTVSEQRADLYEGMMERIEGLGTPTDDAGITDFLDAGNALVDAEQGGDSTEIASAELQFSSAASDVGFEDCGQGPSTPSTAPATGVPSAPTAPATPVTPTAPATAPAPTAPSGGAGTGTGGGTAGGGTGTGGGTGGGTSGSGGVGPG